MQNCNNFAVTHSNELHNCNIPSDAFADITASYNLLFNIISMFGRIYIVMVCSGMFLDIKKHNDANLIGRLDICTVSSPFNR